MSKAIFRLLSCALLMLQSAIGASARADEIVKSGVDDRWVKVTYQADRVSAELHSGASTVTIFSDIPVAGHVSVVWITREIAEADIPCGTECSATFFASGSAMSGPFPQVLSVDKDSLAFAYLARKKIIISMIGPPAQPIGSFQLPEWCPRLQCDFKDSYAKGVYSFTSDGHRIEVPLPQMHKH
jgi:hypothetical protein